MNVPLPIDQEDLPAGPDCIVTFEVPGAPVPLDRARHTAAGAVYNTARVKRAKATIGLHARAAMRGRHPLAGPVKLRATFWRHRKPDAAPDVSNYLKLLEDALNGIAFGDDAQIVTVVAAKRRAERPADERTVVTVSEARA